MRQRIFIHYMRRLLRPAPLLAVTLLLIALTAAFAPAERTLGGNLRLVLLHGAWVWSGKLLFAAAALSGLAGLLRPPVWGSLSRAFGQAGLLFWLTYLPMSLLVQVQNWGGIFWDEPRWRIPFTFGVVGLLLQIALALFDQPRLTSLANLIFGVSLWVMLGGAENVLHPQSPIVDSGSGAIQFTFSLLLALAALAGGLTAALLYRSQRSLTAPSA
ncbi:MAG: hypothetical protein AB1453_01325 [Chloroflexota bacterium]